MKTFKEFLTEAKEEKKQTYKEFFQTVLDKFKVSAPSELDTDKKKEFYSYIDDNWEGEKEDD